MKTLYEDCRRRDVRLRRPPAMTNWLGIAPAVRGTSQRAVISFFMKIMCIELRTRGASLLSKLARTGRVGHALVEQLYDEWVN